MTKQEWLTSIAFGMRDGVTLSPEECGELHKLLAVSEMGEPTLKEMQAMYDAQCACTDEWKTKYDAEKEKKASETLLNRIAELKSQLAEVNQRLAAANEKLLAPSATGPMFDVVQLSEARYYRDHKEPIGILARAILRANGEMK